MSEKAPQSAQPLIEHLLELRRRLMWTIGGLLLCFLALIIFQDFECIAVADFMVQRLYNFSGIDRRNTFDPVTGSPISC